MEFKNKIFELKKSNIIIVKREKWRRKYKITI